MNREISFIIALFSVNTVLLVWSYFNARNGAEHIPLTAIAHITMGLVAFWAASRLFFMKKKDVSMGALNLFFFFITLFMVFMVLPHTYLLFNYKDQSQFSYTMNLGYIIGHVFMYISTAFFVRLPLGWTYPKLKNLGTIFFLLLGAFGTIWNILHPNNPAFDPATGITFFNVDPLVGKLIAFDAALVFVPSAIYFLFKGFKTKEAIVRGRAFIFAAGMIVSIIGGPLHDIARQPVLFLIADILAMAGLSLLAMGVFYKVNLDTLPAVSPGVN